MSRVKYHQQRCDTRVKRWKHTSESNIVKVCGRLDSLELATDVEVLDLVSEVGNSRVRGIVSTENLLCFLHLVRLINVVN